MCPGHQEPFSRTARPVAAFPRPEIVARIDSGRECCTRHTDRPADGDDGVRHDTPGTDLSRDHPQVFVGVGTGRSDLDAAGQRMVHDLLDRDDPPFNHSWSAQQRRLRVGVVVMGTGVGALVGVAGRQGGSRAIRRDPKTRGKPDRRTCRRTTDPRNRCPTCSGQRRRRRRDHTNVERQHRSATAHRRSGNTHRRPAEPPRVTPANRSKPRKIMTTLWSGFTLRRVPLPTLFASSPSRGVTHVDRRSPEPPVPRTARTCPELDKNPAR
jgi:hypothetical protein